MTEISNGNNDYHGIRVAVLGASGFIGRWVARTLCARGASVSLVIRDMAHAENTFCKYGINGKLFKLDLRNVKAIQELFEKTRPSITFNIAGYGVDRSECDEKSSYQINADLVNVIGEVIARVRDPEWPGQDIVHVGSALEYGSIKGNLSEDSYPNPTTLYGKSKLAGTHILTHCCKTYGIKGLTARLFTVYGPGEHPGRLLPSLLDIASTGKPLKLTRCLQRRDFTYVEDVAESLLRLGMAASEPGEIVNLATGKLTSVRSFVIEAAEILTIPMDNLKFGMVPTRAEEMEHDEVNVDRLHRLASWVPRTGIREGIVKTLDCETLHGDGYNRNRQKYETKT